MSLSSEDRLRLLEWASPDAPNDRLEAALILSYSADLPTVFALLLSVMGKDLGANQLEGERDCLDSLLPDLASLSNRARILINPGGLNPHRLKDARLAAAVDQILREVTLPAGLRCSFHPKVSILSYSRGGIKLPLKLFISSRNLTINAALDITSKATIRSASREDSKTGKSLADFLAASLKATQGSVPVPAPIQAVLNEIALGEIVVEEDGSTEFSQAQFFWQGGTFPGGKSLAEASAVTKAGMRRIVVSPFLDEKGLGSLFPSDWDGEGSLLASRPALADVASSPSGHAILEKIDCYGLNLEVLSDFDGLHAKMVIDEFDTHTRVMAGSANATGTAWDGRNWEAMLAWRAPRTTFEEIRRSFFEGSKNRQPLAGPISLRDLGTGSSEDDPEERAIQHALRSLELKGTVQWEGEDVRVTVECSPAGELLNREIRVAPFNSEDWQPFAVYDGGKRRAKFDIRLEDFTHFFEVSCDSTLGKPQTLLRRIMIGAMPEFEAARAEALLRWTVKQAGLSSVLAEYLGDVRWGSGVGAPRTDSKTMGPRYSTADSISGPSLEGLFRLCLNEPDRIAGFERILELQSLDDKDAELLPRLRSIWERLRPVVEELAGREPI